MASLRQDRAPKRHIDLFGTPAAKRGGLAVRSALECEPPGSVQASQGSQGLPRPAQIGRGRPLLGSPLSGEPRPTRTETPASARRFAPRSLARGSNFWPVGQSLAPQSPASTSGTPGPPQADALPQPASASSRASATDDRYVSAALPSGSQARVCNSAVYLPPGVEARGRYTPVASPFLPAAEEARCRFTPAASPFLPARDEESGVRIPRRLHKVPPFGNRGAGSIHPGGLTVPPGWRRSAGSVYPGGFSVSPIWRRAGHPPGGLSVVSAVPAPARPPGGIFLPAGDSLA
jgi:hypothetical protein